MSEFFENSMEQMMKGCNKLLALGLMISPVQNRVVVLPSTRATYIPDKLCVLLDDAKELAAQTTLWNLDSSILTGPSFDSPSSLSPPLAMSPSDCSPSLLSCGGRTFTPCLPAPPPPPPSPFPISPLPSLSAFSPAASQAQRLYFNSQSPFY
ncbi:hypothetical protein CCH79_00018271 [Gambusia affinis]|uniref:Uncharacterized protein n=1 Tax=Gambusia affinis TaxID=33528 RepID=A0A315VXR8_GAMAF|nr:hypothetical protein CCH79_00018271 [Gambusia affinis]